MAAIVRVRIDRVAGWVSASFAYDKPTIAVIKAVPGPRWNAHAKTWEIPIDAWDAVLRHRLRFEVLEDVPLLELPLPETMTQHMRPYQLEAARFLVGRSGALLSMQQRVGKNLPTIAAAAALLQAGLARWVLVVYPGSVRAEWRRQLRKWANVGLIAVDGTDTLPAAEIARLRWQRYLFLGCHYEIIGTHVSDKSETENQAAVELGSLDRIADNNPFVMVLDECQALANRKSARSRAVRALAEHPSCVARWGLSGTPMRNTPRNLWQPLDILNPGSQGKGYWAWAKAYCNPPEAPIWMGDFSMRPLGEIAVGDEVIGWERRTEPVKLHTAGGALRYALTRATVVAVQRRIAPIVKLTMESGRTIRCTPDHHWAAANSFSRTTAADTSRNAEIRSLYEGEGVTMAALAEKFELSVGSIWRIITDPSYEYLPAKIGRKIVRILDDLTPYSPPTTVRGARLAGWVAGMYDGEGHGATISQSSKANPKTLNQLTAALTELGIGHTVTQDSEGGSCGGVHITGGRDGFLRFLRVVGPSGKFRKPDEIVSIEPDGEGEVVSMTTTTGNYVAWGFGSRNCGAFQDDFGHWNDQGESNPEELAARLSVISYRKTRAEVAPWLPKADRVVIDCTPTPKALKRYHKMEQMYATSIVRGMATDEPSAGDREALRLLAKATSEIKIPSAIERIFHHAERGVKFLIFAYFHDTLKRLQEAIDARWDQERLGNRKPPPYWIAGGWETITKRHEAIEAWRAAPAPGFILLNSLSSGIGIDLSDAEVAMFLETAWVPADFQQAEDRIAAIHESRRKVPPIIELLLARGTVDEAMVAVQLKKIRIQEKIVGHNVEATGFASAVRQADVVSSGRLGLESTDKDTVQAALTSIRDRWLNNTGPKSTNEALAAEVGALWEDDDPEEETTEAEESAS